jgi:hypothetical protein
LVHSNEGEKLVFALPAAVAMVSLPASQR